MIKEFTGIYRFLSNFYISLIGFEGMSYPSVEHAFVAAKTLDINERTHIARLLSAAEAKKYGRKVKLRPDWEQVKLQIMEDLVRQKFTKWPLLKQALLDTGDQQLFEGNTWGDRFWGVDSVTLRGENHLGEILMKIRKEIRDGIA